MESETSNPKPPLRPFLNPWLIILLTAPLPLLLFVFFFVKWYNQKTDFTKVTSYFVQRQNTVLAHNAMEVSAGISDLLEKAARDADILSTLPLKTENFQRFYRAQVGDIMLFDAKNEYYKQGLLPFYNKLMFITPKGEVKLYLKNGELYTGLRSVAECREADLCDRPMLDRALTLPVGEVQFGRVLRYYAPEGTAEDVNDASLSVALRAPNGIYVLGLDYRHLKDYLSVPTFPYQPKKNLLQAYINGNYVYIVDSLNNVIVHPKYWDEVGIDKKTGKWMSTMVTDAEDGTHPINVSDYKEGKLKAYFDRLAKKSFAQNALDIFQAPNLAGTIRVLSVAPIVFSRGQFKQAGVFGHVIIGCNVDYFEEPKERFVPYY